MPSPFEIAEPYSNWLVTPVRKVTPVSKELGAWLFDEGACRECFQPCGQYSTCYNCKTHREALPDTADTMVPVSLRVNDAAHPAELKPKQARMMKHQFYWALANYKSAKQSTYTRNKFGLELAAVLACFLEKHETCVADHVGVDRFPLVTIVPSTGGRQGVHPLEEVVCRVRHLKDRYHRLLEWSGPHVPPIAKHTATTRLFRATAQLQQQPVLLIEDTLTQGANAQSAACVLKQAGASAVAVVVIGRQFNPLHNEDCGRYWEEATKVTFDWNRCVLCRSD